MTTASLWQWFTWIPLRTRDKALQVWENLRFSYHTVAERIKLLLLSDEERAVLATHRAKTIEECGPLVVSYYSEHCGFYRIVVVEEVPPYSTRKGREWVVDFRFQVHFRGIDNKARPFCVGHKIQLKAVARPLPYGDPLDHSSYLLSPESNP